jgi:hypothetical protein
MQKNLVLHNISIYRAGRVSLSLSEYVVSYIIINLTSHEQYQQHVNYCGFKVAHRIKLMMFFLFVPGIFRL